MVCSGSARIAKTYFSVEYLTAYVRSCILSSYINKANSVSDLNRLHDAVHKKKTLLLQLK